MGRIVTFHGIDHKAGVSQTALGVAESLTAMGFGRAIMPKIVQRKWVKGTAREEVHSYLPGYVFLYSDAPVSDFLAIRRLTAVDPDKQNRGKYQKQETHQN